MLLIGLLSTAKVNAQREQRWEDCYAELIDMEGESEEDIPDYDLLCDIANHPININQATKEDLEQLPFPQRSTDRRHHGISFSLPFYAIFGRASHDSISRLHVCTPAFLFYLYRKT